ncbi:hypothetical protein LAUMK35_05636 [Mycobacterium pseudokansasii]|nr:hypothetical protein LAUMK35_05636 [Mycobacterium pseudokansasii]VBA35480.1 hypothetical protein LAUMK21_05596 [Mycobacterium pseudokansasii]
MRASSADHGVTLRIEPAGILTCRVTFRASSSSSTASCSAARTSRSKQARYRYPRPARSTRPVSSRSTAPCPSSPARRPSPVHSTDTFRSPFSHARMCCACSARSLRLPSPGTTYKRTNSSYEEKVVSRRRENRIVCCLCAAAGGADCDLAAASTQSVRRHTGRSGQHTRTGIHDQERDAARAQERQPSVRDTVPASWGTKHPTPRPPAFLCDFVVRDGCRGSNGAAHTAS